MSNEPDDLIERRFAAADNARAHYARALEKMRLALVAVHDGMEDEGDRIYFGSTNHAEDLKAAWLLADALHWDEILAHTQPETDLAKTNDRLQVELSEAADRLETYKVEIEALREMLGDAARDLRLEANNLSPNSDNYPASWMRELAKTFTRALIKQEMGRFAHRRGYGPGDGGAGFPDGVEWPA